MIATLFTIALALATQVSASDSTLARLEAQAQNQGVTFEVPGGTTDAIPAIAASPNPLPRLSTGGDGDRVELSATTAYGFDRGTGKSLYEKNPHERVAMASITKVMTAIVVMEQEADLDREIEVPLDGVKIEGSNMALLPGEVLTIRELLYGLMVNSANDAAKTLAIEVGGSVSNFVRLMNQKANELGLEDTNFANPEGLDAPEHYSTAFDIGQLADFAYRNQELVKMSGTRTMTIVSRDYTGTTHYLQNTDKLLAENTGVFTGKTGFTDNAGLCLVSIAERNGRQIVNVVMGSQDRAEDTKRLLDWEYANYDW